CKTLGLVLRCLG
nr:immunoglobulin heavy chain junction region [Mus musculus]